MSHKGKGKVDIDDASIEEYLHVYSPKTFSSEQAVSYFLFALLLTLFPAYLYYSIYEDSGFSLLYLIVSAGSAVLLTYAYRNVETGTNAQLEQVRKFGAAGVNHKRLKQSISKESAEKLQEEITGQESVAWAFFFQ